MPDNPLFYRSVVPLNRETHRDLRLDRDGGHYGFTRSSHIMPAVIDEFAAACRHVPIVFVPGMTQPTPVFLVGLRPGTNLMVDQEGRWTGSYVPAFARRYPFILGEVEQRDPLACIDEAYEGFSQELGDRLFGEDGSDTDFLRERIRLMNDYYVAAKRTDAFAALLNQMQLLRPVTIEARLGGNESATIHGVLTVDEAKLGTMPEQDFLKLRAESLLGPIYAHLVSLAAVDRLRPTPATEAVAAPALDSEDETADFADA